MTTAGLVRFCLLTAGAIAVPGFALRVPPAPSAEDILARSKAAYASLKSYADSGTVLLEYGPVGPVNGVVRELHTFRTYYRAPRSFLFDFAREKNTDRFVVWSDDQAFHTWWKTTGVEESYPKGQGVTAFATGAPPTKGSLTQIAPLLFATSGLAGTVTEFGDVTDTRTEKLDGHPCYRLTGVAKSVYRATGREVNVRPTIVWIDSETLLVRKVVETLQAPPEDVNMVTTTFSPHANPTLSDASFRFTPPAKRP